jgi:hypothetical protein
MAYPTLQTRVGYGSKLMEVLARMVETAETVSKAGVEEAPLDLVCFMAVGAPPLEVVLAVAAAEEAPEALPARSRSA